MNKGTQNVTKPVGRMLRFLFGLWMIWLIVPFYLGADLEMIAIALGIIVGLIAFYIVIQILVSRFWPNLNRWLGAILAWIPDMLIFFLGGSSGQVGVFSFVGVSLLLASIRSDSGCEVMSIPGMIFGKHTQLACLFFSPIDWLEERIDAYIHKR